jgi:chitinase
MSEVLELSPSSREEDIAYFQSLVAQIQMMRKQISELAKVPQLLSELYEIASQKGHIKYIQADKGYSGIYPCYLKMQSQQDKLCRYTRHKIEA